MTEGGEGVWEGPKKDDVIYEQPLIEAAIAILSPWEIKDINSTSKVVASSGPSEEQQCW